MHTITTETLIEQIQKNANKYVEARLVGCLYSFTHFLFWAGEKTLIDEGIDGEVCKTNFSAFHARYKGNYWIIDHIV